MVVDSRQDANASSRERVLALSVTDEADREADACTLRLDNRGGAIEPPPRGTELEVSLGYRDSDATFTGTYVVDKIGLATPRRRWLCGPRRPTWAAGWKAKRRAIRSTRRWPPSSA